MHILFIAESFPTSELVELTGGVETRDFYLAKLLGQNHQVTVVTNGRRGVARNQKLFGANIIRVGLDMPEKDRESSLVRLVFLVEAVLKGISLNADLVQGSNVFSQAIAFVIGVAKGIPKVALIPDIYIGDWIKNTGLITGLVGEALERIVIRLPWNKIISWSDSTKEKLTSKGTNPKRIQVIHGGVDLAAIQEIKAAKTSYPSISTAARLVSYKRIQDLVKAVAILKAKYPKLKLTIAGDGPEHPNLETLSRISHLASRITFAGRLNHQDTLKLIKSSTLFCLPSVVEGFGLVTIEAAASGTPYVNSAIAPTIEVTRNGQGGLLHQPADPEDLASKIDIILSDKKLYLQKQKEAVQLAANYDWSICAEKTSKLFQRIEHKK